MKARIWEIDFLRMTAIMLMVVFHAVYDLRIFAGWDINYSSGFWYWVGKIAALLFMCISGISTGFSSKGAVKSGVKLIAFAMVVSLATYVVFGDQYVRFGILHFLGTCMLLYPLLVKFPSWLLAILGVVIVWSAGVVGKIFVDTAVLLPLGIRYSGFATVDYYPLVPYLAVYILGILMYKQYYYRKESIFPFQFNNAFVSYISRHSLAIYLLHQPLLIGIILLIKQVVN